MIPQGVIVLATQDINEITAGTVLELQSNMQHVIGEIYVIVTAVTDKGDGSTPHLETYPHESFFYGMGRFRVLGRIFHVKNGQHLLVANKNPVVIDWSNVSTDTPMRTTEVVTGVITEGDITPKEMVKKFCGFSFGLRQNWPETPDVKKLEIDGYMNTEQILIAGAVTASICDCNCFKNLVSRIQNESRRSDPLHPDKVCDIRTS